MQITKNREDSDNSLPSGKQRSVRTLTSNISKISSALYKWSIIEINQTDWDEWLPYIKFTYNTTPHIATEFTSFELMYDYQAILSTALIKQPKQTYYEDYTQELRERIRVTNQLAK